MSRMGKTAVSQKPVPGAKKKIQAFQKLKRGLFGITHHQSLDFLAQCFRKNMRKGQKSMGFSAFSNHNKVRIN